MYLCTVIHNDTFVHRELRVAYPTLQSSRVQSGYLTTLYSNEDCQRRGDLSPISPVDS